MKLRSFFLGLLAVVLVLLGLGGAGAYWLTAHSPLQVLTAGGDRLPNAAMFVSKQAPAMVSLLVAPKDMKALRQVLVAPNQRRQARLEWEQVEQSVLTGTGLTFERDIQPWMGDEITLAITSVDLDRDPGNGSQPGYLLAIASADVEQAREFLQILWQKRAIAGTDLTFEQYKGVKLIYNEVPIAAAPDNPVAKILPSPSLATAIVGEGSGDSDPAFILFANHPKVLREAITNVQVPTLNLDNAPFYREALETLTKPRLGVALVNVPQIAAWLEGVEVLTPPPAVRPPAASLRPAQTLAIALELDPQGLVLETAVSAPDRPAIAPRLTTPIAALQYVPATSGLTAASTNLQQLWTETAAQIQDYPTLATVINSALQTVKQTQQLDLPQDIFPWVTGEYALAHLPNPVPKAAKGAIAPDQPSGDWIFVAERGKGEPTTAALAHLDDLAQQQGYSIGAVPLGDRSVSVWTKLTPDPDACADRRRPCQSLQAEVQAVHATVGQYELFTNSLNAMEQAFQAEAQGLLAQPAFQQAIAGFPTPNNGYLYLDWRRSQALLERRVPLLAVLELVASPVFSHLDSVTVSSYGRQAGIQRSVVRLRFT